MVLRRSSSSGLSSARLRMPSTSRITVASAGVGSRRSRRQPSSSQSCVRSQTPVASWLPSNGGAIGNGPTSPRLAVAPGVDVARGATDTPRVARVSAQGATPCAERRKQLPLLGSVRLGLSSAVVRVTHASAPPIPLAKFAVVIGELLKEAAARHYGWHLFAREPFPHRRLWTKTSRPMLQVTRSTVEDGAALSSCRRRKAEWSLADEHRSMPCRFGRPSNC